jgi:hypothetical protein
MRFAEPCAGRAALLFEADTTAQHSSGHVGALRADAAVHAPNAETLDSVMSSKIYSYIV